MSGDIVSVDEENVSETGGIETKRMGETVKKKTGVFGNYEIILNQRYDQRRTH